MVVAVISVAVVPDNAWAGKQASGHTSAASGGAHQHNLATNNAKSTTHTAYLHSTSVTNINPGKFVAGSNQTPGTSARLVQQRYYDPATQTVRIRTIRVEGK